MTSGRALVVGVVVVLACASGACGGRHGTLVIEATTPTSQPDPDAGTVLRSLVVATKPPPPAGTRPTIALPALADDNAFQAVVLPMLGASTALDVVVYARTGDTLEVRRLSELRLGPVYTVPADDPGAAERAGMVPASAYPPGPSKLSLDGAHGISVQVTELDEPAPAPSVPPTAGGGGDAAVSSGPVRVHTCVAPCTLMLRPGRLRIVRSDGETHPVRLGYDSRLVMTQEHGLWAKVVGSTFAGLGAAAFLVGAIIAHGDCEDQGADCTSSGLSTALVLGGLGGVVVGVTTFGVFYDEATSTVIPTFTFVR